MHDSLTYNHIIISLATFIHSDVDNGKLIKKKLYIYNFFYFFKLIQYTNNFKIIILSVNL